MANPFLSPAPVVLTPEQALAARLDQEYATMISEGRRAYDMNLRVLTNCWKDVWENRAFSPAQKLLRMGTNACTVFDTAAALALMLYTIDPTSLDVKYLSAKLPYDRHEDGTITLQDVAPTE